MARLEIIMAQFRDRLGNVETKLDEVLALPPIAEAKKAKAEAKAILEAAHAEAGSIIEATKAEAESILAAAKTEAKKLAAKAEAKAPDAPTSETEGDGPEPPEGEGP
jgi:F0F1-type ATP synthase membrane subunit b/b'